MRKKRATHLFTQPHLPRYDRDHVHFKNEKNGIEEEAGENLVSDHDCARGEGGGTQELQRWCVSSRACTESGGRGWRGAFSGLGCASTGGGNVSLTFPWISRLNRQNPLPPHISHLREWIVKHFQAVLLVFLFIASASRLHYTRPHLGIYF